LATDDGPTPRQIRHRPFGRISARTLASLLEMS
jgi:hypothetical protein